MNDPGLQKRISPTKKLCCRGCRRSVSFTRRASTRYDKGDALIVYKIIICCMHVYSFKFK
uniref:Uncharacterized protein n=1 Tax=Anguilla anguilla TaxID=7936 RepID=A0A0E9R8U8_ANGAN